MATLTVSDRSQDPEATQLALVDLERYAGWLSRGFAPTRVRDAVKALRATVADHGDVFASVQGLEADIEKLGSGEVARLLRRRARSLRVALGPAVR